MQLAVLTYTNWSTRHNDSNEHSQNLPDTIEASSAEFMRILDNMFYRGEFLLISAMVVLRVV